ncbi:peptidase M20 [Hyphomonas sediminis]|uniref:peptidase M20 n=1 Tax=Hyphomonas sediminis TaxID=2866160 RepID=UPI001CECC99C|nr:peptidase M20 [Hyphomonas sediminis]
MSNIFKNLPEANYAVSEEDAAALAAAIDKEEMTKVALELGNIPSPARGEAQAAEYVYQWLAKEGFRPRKVGATPERPNVIATYGGKGDGKSLLYTAHLDTESPTWNPDEDAYKFRPETLEVREWNECWLEDGAFHGYPIANDRGPMTCFLFAAKALKKCGFDLSGRLYLTASPGEIGPEPIEEARGVDFMGKEIGTHYVFNHGGVSPDYAIAAEGCDYGLTWIGCGYIVFRIRLYGEAIFTPLLNSPRLASQHPNPIYRMGSAIQPILDWSLKYEAESRYESEGGSAFPKVQLSAVRGGVPHVFGAGTEVCAIYLEVGLAPNQEIGPVHRDLEKYLRAANIGEFDIEPVVVRHGFEADAARVSPLVSAVDVATRLTLGKPVERAAPVYSSMWRDHNVFNMNRVPAITTGFKRWRPTPDDLAKSALIYALTALALCGKADSEEEAARKKPVYGDNPFG